MAIYHFFFALSIGQGKDNLEGSAVGQSPLICSILNLNLFYQEGKARQGMAIGKFLYDGCANCRLLRFLIFRFLFSFVPGGEAKGNLCIEGFACRLHRFLDFQFYLYQVGKARARLDKGNLCIEGSASRHLFKPSHAPLSSTIQPNTNTNTKNTNTKKYKYKYKCAEVACNEIVPHRLPMHTIYCNFELICCKMLFFGTVGGTKNAIN